MSADAQGAALYRSVNESVFALHAEGQHARAHLLAPHIDTDIRDEES